MALKCTVVPRHATDPLSRRCTLPPLLVQAQRDRAADQASQLALLEEVEHLKRQLQLAQMETTAVKADAAVDENQLRESLDALRSELKEEAAAHAKDTATLEQAHDSYCH